MTGDKVNKREPVVRRAAAVYTLTQGEKRASFSSDDAAVAAAAAAAVAAATDKRIIARIVACRAPDNLLHQ